MSLLNKAPEPKGKRVDLYNLGLNLAKYGTVLGLSALFPFAVFDSLEKHYSQIQDDSKAPQVRITQKADKNPLAENANQPASLNRSGGDTSQVPSNDSESYLGAVEEASRSKKNFFRVAHYFFFFSGLLCSILFTLGHAIFLQFNQQKGR